MVFDWFWFLCVSAHVDHEDQYIQSMEKFGDNCVGRDDADVGTAFIKFAVFTRELAALFKNLVRRLSTHDSVNSFPLRPLLEEAFSLMKTL